MFTHRVLVVDDCPDVCEILHDGLTEDGFEVRTCLEGLRAMQEAVDFRPNVILLDMKLEDTDGWTVAGLLRANPITAAIPFIVLSAIHNVWEQTASLHPNAVMSKPFDLDAVTTACRDVIKVAGAIARTCGGSIAA